MRSESLSIEDRHMTRSAYEENLAKGGELSFPVWKFVLEEAWKKLLRGRARMTPAAHFRKL